MKIVIVVLLFILGSFSLYGDAETNRPPELTLRRVALERTGTEGLPRDKIFLRLFENRLSFTFTNIFSTYRVPEFERERDRLGFGFSEHLADEARNAFSRGTRLALRQFAVEEIPLVSEVRANWASALRNTLTGYEEKENLVSPFDSREGIPTQEGLRQPRNLKFGWRPFRTNPYAFVSWGRYSTDGERIFTTSFRIYGEDWHIPKSELIAELPVGRGFSLAGAVTVRPLETERLKIAEGSIGLAKLWNNGEFYVGATYPLAGFVASFGFRW
ncbi:MAG: hypothetical protein UX89_C0021G0012 [Parcubacteria group bacterium GW2011_GWA2_47_16]|nr:MAG: hypothetical protein UX89_C0021G0012 [Parcubacteria group bacterium GW2011_GWA2_47_16]